MQVKATILLSVLPLAVAHLGYPIDVSINATSSSYGGYYCPGPWPGGYLGDPFTSHPFYFGADCYVTDGQPGITLEAWFAAVLFTGIFIYLVFWVRKELGYSSFLRDLSAYYFWLAFSWWWGAMLHTMAYVGCQYPKEDVPGWVYSWGLASWFLEYIAANADGFLKTVIGLRLIFESYCTCTSTEPLWRILHSCVYLFIIPADINGHFTNGTYVQPFATFEGFNAFSEVLLIVYGVIKCKPLAIFSGVLEFSYYFFVPVNILSWQYFNAASYSDGIQTFGWFLFFIICMKHLRTSKTESKTVPLLM